MKKRGIEITGYSGWACERAEFNVPLRPCDRLFGKN